ncbi:CysS/YqeB C-terminal domain-containing protein [Acrocarpospora catenulata]|uniref:CysS/YqeB C-terminal domain-containing protein n=1 Tax=Acrocarpospora catenulata TaxID=2836182 RepID=UPI001BD942AD|nr:hypothetical protein [Acrocarpospora catenulata]
MTLPPPDVVELAERRARARTDRDFAGADALREEITAAGWIVRDTPGGGFELTAKPPFEVWPTVASIPVSAVLVDISHPHSPPGEAPTGAAAAIMDDPTAPGGMIETALTPAGTPSMIASQLLWDGSSATSRIDELIAEHQEPQVEVPEFSVSAGLVVDGWPDDLRACVEALMVHTTARVIALDLGDVDGAGRVLHELAERYPDRISEWHVAEKPHWRGGSAGWGAARSKLLHLDDAEMHVVMETSTIVEGDAITPLVTALQADGVAAAGWRGANPAGDGHQWEDAGPGEVTALLGYLFAVRRATALGAGGFPERARFYRNADLEFSLSLPGRLIVPEKDLPVRQERHRGYYDVDAAYRDKESRRTYERVLKRLRATP